MESDLANLVTDEEHELSDLISAHEHVAMLRDNKVIRNTYADNGVDLSSLMPEASSSDIFGLSLMLLCSVVLRALS